MIAWAGVRNSNHFGAAGYYANMAVRHDMLGIAMSNADPNMVVPGARGRSHRQQSTGVCGACGRGVPDSAGYRTQRGGRGQDPIAMKELKQPIPSTWLTDEDGMPVDEVGDWPASGSMLPMAGHKGYGIALLIETMAGLLPGAGVLDEAKSWILNPTASGLPGSVIRRHQPGDHLPIEDFKRRVDMMIRKIRGSPKSKNSSRVYLPGEIEWERREEALKNGIPLPVQVLTSLQGAPGISA